MSEQTRKKLLEVESLSQAEFEELFPPPNGHTSSTPQPM